MDLSAKEIEKVKFTFSVYDFDGTNIIDAYYIGPALRALGLTPSLSAIANLGGTKRKGEKTLQVEEFLAIYADAKKNKDVGTMDDFLECLKSSDKEGDGKIATDQLSHILQAYGERLDPEDIAEIIADCGNPHDGFISYVPFLKCLMDGPDMEATSFSGDQCSSSSVPITKAPEPDGKVSNVQSNSEESKEIPSLTMSDAKPMAESGVNAVHTVKLPKQKPRSPSVTEDTKAAAASAAFTLKTPKPRSPSVTEDTKAAAAAAAQAALKPKNQQFLIAMKTKGLIQNIK